MQNSNHHPNRPPRPPNTYPTKLSVLSPSPKAHTLIALLLGLSGPTEITKKDSTKTLLAVLHLADESLPSGVELKIWGRQALRVVNLHVMDVLHLTKIVVLNDRFGPILSFRGDTTVCKAVSEGGYREIVDRLMRWRGLAHSELMGFAERGRLRSREWASGTGERLTQDCTLASAVKGVTTEVDFVHITSLRIRVPRTTDKTELDAVRSLCRRVCSNCSKRLSERQTICKCGGIWKWGFGWLLLGLRDGSGEFVAVCEGEVLRRLLFGVEVERILLQDDIARECAEVLRGLVSDGGVFRVVVRGRGDGRLELRELLV